MKIPQACCNYSVDDFILDESFQQWVWQQKNEENWQTWLSEHPEKRHAVQKASKFLLAIRIKENLPSQQQQDIALEKLRNRGEKRVNVRRMALFRRVAATILLVLAATTLFWLLNRQYKIEVNTGYGQIKTVELPDNSTVILNANSSLTYFKSPLHQFNRRVCLKGEAFFDIEKSKSNIGRSRNFEVLSGKIKIEVLGTRFNVNNRRGANSVTLQEGKVKVHTLNGDEAEIKPGERLEYHSDKRQLTKSKVPIKRYVSWKMKRYVFDKTPLSEITQIIEENFGYEVIVNDKTLAAQQVSGVIESDKLENFINALAFALDVHIYKENKKLYFEPKSKRK